MNYVHSSQKHGCQSCLPKVEPKWTRDPQRVTKIWLLPPAKCANGLANAFVFTGGLSARTRSRARQWSAPARHSGVSVNQTF